jgi:hypothetical protein
MRRFLMTLMVALTLSNAALAVYACSCSGQNGSSCSGKYCRTTSEGNCECQDTPFEIENES